MSCRVLNRRRKTEVRRSPIAGRGLFACRAFRRGDFIITAICRRTDNDTGAYTCWAHEGVNWRIINKVRFVNHSNHPNAWFSFDNYIVALRRIEPGEEITIDYGPGYREFPR